MGYPLHWHIDNVLDFKKGDEKGIRFWGVKKS